MKLNTALLLLADDSPSGTGSMLGLLLFMLALIAVAGVMAASATKRSWESAAVTCFLWLIAGLLMQPWNFFIHGATTVIQVDDYWAPLWKIAAIIWAASLLLCFVLLVAIYRGKKSRRRRRRSSRGSSRSGEGESRRRDDGSRRRSESSRRSETESPRKEKENLPVEDDDSGEEEYDDSYEV